LILIFRVVFNSPSIQKNLGFDPSFYTMELNNMQKISIKRLSFSILDLASRDKKLKEPRDAIIRAINSAC